MASVATALADVLAEADPDNATTYADNAQDAVTNLEALDADLAEGLADCERRDLVTSHRAFGYLADRYDLAQVGIAGLSPSDEPSPADLAALADFVEDNDVNTIYFETLVSPAVAETLASETGTATAVLDPLEGLTDESEGDDYLAVMRSNLASLRAGQPCP
jgi:zinc transport system substrate-binding protein